MRRAVGPDYPVLIKLNSEDFVEGGFSLEEMLEVSALLEKAGIDAIELSGGTGSEASKYKPVRFGTSLKKTKPTTGTPHDGSNKPLMCRSSSWAESAHRT